MHSFIWLLIDPRAAAAIDIRIKESHNQFHRKKRTFIIIIFFIIIIIKVQGLIKVTERLLNDETQHSTKKSILFSCFS